MRKIATAALASVFALLVCSSGSNASILDFFHKKDPTIYSNAEINEAINYVNMNIQNSIYIFPNKFITYGITEEPSRFTIIYKNNYASITGGALSRYSGITNIIVVIIKNKNEFERIIGRLNIDNGYKNDLTNMYESMRNFKKWCSFKKILSRKRWLNKGFIIVDAENIGHGIDDNISECISGGFDFMSGIPFSKEFAYLDDIPSKNARSAIINSAYKCSVEHKSESTSPESSRDGISERPSISCVIEEISSLKKSQEN